MDHLPREHFHPLDENIQSLVFSFWTTKSAYCSESVCVFTFENFLLEVGCYVRRKCLARECAGGKPSLRLWRRQRKGRKAFKKGKMMICRHDCECRLWMGNGSKGRGKMVCDRLKRPEFYSSLWLMSCLQWIEYECIVRTHITFFKKGRFSNKMMLEMNCPRVW